LAAVVSRWKSRKRHPSCRLRVILVPECSNWQLSDIIEKLRIRYPQVQDPQPAATGDEPMGGNG